MPSAYSDDFRRSVINYVEQGHSRCEAARVFGTSPSFVIKLIQCYKATGCYRAYKRGGNCPATLQNLYEVITDWIGAERDITLAEMAAWLKGEYQTYASLSGLSDMLRRNGYTYKKNVIGGRSGTWQAPKATS